MDTGKSEFLHPVNTVLRLASLSIELTGTKLQVANHALRLDTPSKFQWFFRSWNGDSKEDIGTLYRAIVRWNNIYMKPLASNSEHHESQNLGGFGGFGYGESPTTVTTSNNEKYVKSLKRISELACYGLKVLQNTYTSGNVVFVLQYFILLLRSGINGTFSNDELPECLILSDNSLINDDKLKQLWEEETIIRVADLLDHCYNDYLKQSTGTNVSTTAMKDAIIKILDVYDHSFRGIVESTNKA